MVSILQSSPNAGVELRTVSDNFDMLAEGVIDSLGFLELIVELESRLGVEIDLSDMNPEQLARVGPLSRYIAGRCKPA